MPPILLEADEPNRPAKLETDPKFAVGSISVPPAAARELAVLPESYGTGRLWLVSRDAHSLYARWDLTDAQQSHYTSLAVRRHLAIRVHLDGLPGTQISEVQVAPESRHVFIQVAFAGRSYAAELGYYQANQEWRSIAVSERVATPPDSVADDKTARFATFTPLPFRPSPLKPGPDLGQYAGAHFSAPNPPPWAGATSEFERRVPGAEPSMPIDAPFIQADPRTEFGLDPIPAQEWTPAQEEALSDIIDWTVERYEPVSSAEFIHFRQPQQAGPISSLEITLPGGPMPVWIPSGQQISSPAGGEFVRPKGFWFGVNAELVIYGATDPSAQVAIGGRPIRLRPDGTFSYRFALPDGRYELPIQATSVDGEVRRAELEFMRGTRYEGDVRAEQQDPSLKPPEPGGVS
ncbi:MAG TPA: DUF4912 domain-containing protein [Candidatus Limnocylindrales bacterium]|nr:DUF4912 domain-containing protein [Candidatus Limnocylindrales bacterium]